MARSARIVKIKMSALIFVTEAGAMVESLDATNDLFPHSDPLPWTALGQIQHVGGLRICTLISERVPP